VFRRSAINSFLGHAFPVQVFLAALLALFSATRVQARTRPHYGGTLRVEIAGDGITSPDALVLHLLLDGLTRFGSYGSLQPALATSWKSEDNAHHWEFALRPGVQFHNGSTLTADRVVASLNLSCNGSCPWATVRAVGSSVVFVGDSPMPNLPALLAEKQFLISLADASESKPSTCCIGTGPFQLSTPSSAQRVQLAANDGYWGSRPFVDRIEIATGKSLHEQWLDLSLGRTDVVEAPAENLRQAQQQRLTIAQSPRAELLALEISESGALANPLLRGSIAQAVDRSALFNVIFQKQGEITASLLPHELTGYGFLFPSDRDLNKAHELRGGLACPPLTLGYDGDGAMQLAAQRIALNLTEAGFNVQAAALRASQHADLTLRALPLEGADPAAAMEILLRAAGEQVSVSDRSTLVLYRAEHDFLARDTLVPLLDLPRAYAFGSRVRDLTLLGDGAPDLSSVSLEDAP
jgi:MarR-like DNA-binding transcriptional regulator SgrR of sgrS sRNA